MRALSLLAAVAIAAVVLSGCASKSSDSSSPSPTAASTTSAGTTSHAPSSSGVTAGPGPSSSAPPASSGTGAPNKAPSPTLTASTLGGNLPLKVNFTLNAKDADGDAMTWTFDANGDGKADKTGKSTDFPAKANYTYSAKGNYTASFTVSDGKNSTTVKQVIAVAEVTKATTTSSCKVDVGSAGVGIGGLPINFGNCDWGAIAKDQAVKALDVPANCQGDYDTGTKNASGSESYAAATVGKTYKKGTDFAMFCDAPAAQATGTITWIDP